MFICFCIAVVLAGITGLFAANLSNRSDRSAARVVTVVLGVLAALLLLGSMVTVVGSREVGIVTSFGKYQSTEGPGWHFNAPGCVRRNTAPPGLYDNSAYSRWYRGPHCRYKCHHVGPVKTCQQVCR